MVCTTVILLVVLCFICFLVFLRKNDRPKTQKKEGFTENRCNRDLSCSSPEEVKHTIYLGDGNEKSGCCEIQNSDGKGRYFTENGCEQCPVAPVGIQARLMSNQPTRINSNDTQTSNSTTIHSCYALCKTGGNAPYHAPFGMTGQHSYNDEVCDTKTHYSNLGSNLYLQTTSQTIEADEICSNITASNAHNSNKYCCSNDKWLRYNSNYNGGVGCCPSDEYLNSNGGCEKCPNDAEIDTSNAIRSGISACYIKNCRLGPATAYHNGTANSGYNCYSNYYYYESTASSTPGVDNTISERPNDISYDGSNYFYPHSSSLSSNSSNTIGSNSFDTTSNWFYDHGDSNHNSVPSSPDLKTTSYTQQLSYSNYYQCEANKFLRCETSPAPAVRSCICCSSNEYNSNAAGSCKSINSNTHKIADSNLKRNIKGSCNPGWGKSNNECVQCDVYEFSAGGSNICQRCPHGQYPKSDQSACEDADGDLNQSNYRIKEASGANYLHYNDSNVFKKLDSNQLQYTGSNNMYVWKSNQSSTSTPTKYYLQVETTPTPPTPPDTFGNFLISTPSSDISTSKSVKSGSLTFNLIPYCPAGKYADEDSCSNCPAGTWSSTAGLEHVSDCSACATGTFSTEGSSNCSRCEGGTYSTVGSSNCSPCSGNGISSNDGARGCSICGDGTKPNSSNTECQICPENTAGRNGVCNDCGTNETHNDSRTECQCSSNYYKATDLISWTNQPDVENYTFTGCKNHVEMRSECNGTLRVRADYADQFYCASECKDVAKADCAESAHQPYCSIQYISDFSSATRCRSRGSGAGPQASSFFG